MGFVPLEHRSGTSDVSQRAATYTCDVKVAQFVVSPSL